MNEEEAKDIDQSFDKEDNTATVRERAARGPQVKFPQRRSSKLGIFGDMMPYSMLQLITSVQ